MSQPVTLDYAHNASPIDRKDFYLNSQFHLFEDTKDIRAFKIKSHSVSLFVYCISTDFGCDSRSSFGLLSWSPLPPIAPFRFMHSSSNSPFVASFQSFTLDNPTFSPIQEAEAQTTEAASYWATNLPNIDPFLHSCDRSPYERAFQRLELDYSQLTMIQRYYELLLSSILSSTKLEFLHHKVLNEFSPLLLVPLVPSHKTSATSISAQSDTPVFAVDWAEIQRVISFDGAAVDLHALYNSQEQSSEVQSLLSSHLLIHKGLKRRMTFNQIDVYSDLSDLYIYHHNECLGSYMTWLQYRWHTSDEEKEKFYEAVKLSYNLKTANNISYNTDKTTSIVITSAAPSIDRVTNIQLPKRFSRYQEVDPASPIIPRDELQYIAVPADLSALQHVGATASGSSVQSGLRALQVSSKSDVKRHICYLTDLELHPIRLQTVVDLLYLPHLLWHIYRAMTVSTARTLHFPNLELKHSMLLESALTTASCVMSYDYERLELLGDSLLKYLATVFVVSKYPGSKEGMSVIYTLLTSTALSSAAYNYVMLQCRPADVDAK